MVISHLGQKKSRACCISELIPDGEWVPLEHGYLRNFDEDPVARAVLEAERFLDHQLGHPENIAIENHSRSSLWA